MQKIIVSKIKEWVYVAALVAVGLFVAYHTFPAHVLSKCGVNKPDGIVELSGFAAFLSYATLGLLLFRFSISYMFPGWDMKVFRLGDKPDPRIWASVIIAIALIIAASVAKAETPLHLRIALKYENVVEKPKDSNRGAEVEMFLRSVGLGGGYPWCAAFTAYCLREARATEPTVRSAMARAYITQKSIRAADVLAGKVSIPPGALIIWQRGSGPQGHIGFVIRQSAPNIFETIEGNTSSGNAGSQFDGGGAYRRRRSISLTNHFRITHFTLVTYA